MTAQPISVYLADDDEVYLAGLKSLIENNEAYDFKVIGSATTVQQAYKDIMILKPNVALLDIEYKDKEKNGLDLVKELNAKKTTTKCIMYSRLFANNELMTAKRNGASGFIAKELDLVVIYSAISLVMLDNYVEITPLDNSFEEEFKAPPLTDVEWGYVCLVKKFGLHNVPSYVEIGQMITPSITGDAIKIRCRNIADKLKIAGHDRKGGVQQWVIENREAILKICEEKFPNC